MLQTIIPFCTTFYFVFFEKVGIHCRTLRTNLILLLYNE